MSWKNRVIELYKRFGAPAKFAAKMILGAALPGGSAVVELVGEVLDCVHETAKDNLAVEQASAADLQRVEEVLAVLTSELNPLMAQMIALADLPERAAQVLDIAMVTDDRCRHALHRLDHLARHFDRLEEQNKKLLEGQGYAAGMLAEMLPLMRRMVSVVDYIDDLYTAGVSPADFRNCLHEFQEAARAFRAGRIAEAERRFQKVAQSQPQSAAAATALAGAKAARQDFLSAEQSIAHAARLRPDDPELTEMHRRVTVASRGMTPREQTGLGVAWRQSSKVGDTTIEAFREALQLERASSPSPPQTEEEASSPGMVDRPSIESQQFTVEVSIPGCWCRRTDDHEVEWEKVLDTPETVTIDRVQVYGLSVSPDVTDEQLTPLNNLRGLANLRALDLGICKRLTDAGLAHLHGLTQLQSLVLTECGQLTDAGLAHLSELAELQALGLSRCEQLTDVGLAHLSGLTNLQKLDLGGCRQLTDEGFAHLRELVNLQSLNLSRCSQLTDAGLAHLRGLTKLQTLNLHCCIRVTDAGLAYLRGFANMQSLLLCGCRQLTDAGLAHLRGLTNLRSLNLSYTPFMNAGPRFTDEARTPAAYVREFERLMNAAVPRFTDAGLALLGGLPNLQTLDLCGCKQLTDAGLAHLSGLTQLQSLVLRECDQLTDAGLAHLSRLTNLHSLDMGICRQLTDAGLAHLHGLTNLQALDLSYCEQLTDAGFAHLRGLTNLQTLDLSCCMLTDAGLARLRRLIKLKELNLGCCVQLTDAGLAHLYGLHNLQTLDLRACMGLTDAGLTYLHRLTSLQSLDLSECEQVTEGGVEALRIALPRCGIEYNSGG